MTCAHPMPHTPRPKGVVACKICNAFGVQLFPEFGDTRITWYVKGESLSAITLYIIDRIVELSTTTKLHESTSDTIDRAFRRMQLLSRSAYGRLRRRGEQENRQ